MKASARDGLCQRACDHGVSQRAHDGRSGSGREPPAISCRCFMTIRPSVRVFEWLLRGLAPTSPLEAHGKKSAQRQAGCGKPPIRNKKRIFLARVSHAIRTPLSHPSGFFKKWMAEERFGPIGTPRYLEYANDIGEIRQACCSTSSMICSTSPRSSPVRSAMEFCPRVLA